MGGTRDRLLQAAGDLFSRQGYSGTGLKAVIGRAGVPLGSLYHFFPNGKAQLGAEAILDAGQRLERRMRRLLEAQVDPCAGVEALFAAEAEHLERTAFEGGCPVAGATLDVACDSQEVRAACAAVFASWLAVLVQAFEAWGHDCDTAQTYGHLVLTGLEGAILVSRAEGSTQPLLRTQRALCTLLAAASRATA